MLCILDAESPLSQKDIIRNVLISQPSVWRNITLLEDRGLVKADSERRISLTAQGSRLMKHILSKSE
ncbi:winged helix-turn-helix transcriptional regulator [Desulfoluna butyratoxydans]|uniref:winged helix-turn-helix transcriptional regulator n=1 Tax=Desulfoluna butyratoxydans TaxID=231438 RepID=UPI003CCDFB1C